MPGPPRMCRPRPTRPRRTPAPLTPGQWTRAPRMPGSPTPGHPTRRGRHPFRLMGLGDCDGDPANGCEVDLRNNPDPAAGAGWRAPGRQTRSARAGRCGATCCGATECASTATATFLLGRGPTAARSTRGPTPGTAAGAVECVRGRRAFGTCSSPAAKPLAPRPGHARQRPDGRRRRRHPPVSVRVGVERQRRSDSNRPPARRGRGASWRAARRPHTKPSGRLHRDHVPGVTSVPSARR